MFSIVGINHKSAPVAIREQFVLNEVVRIADVDELVALSTCNRTELISVIEHSDKVKAWLQTRSDTDIDKYTYHYTDEAALVHLMKVACGLDSMVLGEPQILGQMKGAFALATEHGNSGRFLGHLFPFIFSVAKKIRSQTDINVNSLSVAYMAVNLAKTIFSDLSNAKVLLVGAGETIQLAAQHLYDIPVQQITIANRTVEKSVALAERLSAEVIRIGDIPKVLADVDVVISSTASQLPIIGKGLLERVSKQRKHKPMFMVDLAVPRDIEPEAGDLADIYLYNVDDIQGAIQENLRHRQLAAQQAEAIIAAEVKHFLRWQNSLKSVPTICAYRAKMQSIRDAEVEKAKRALKLGKPADEVVERLGHDLTNKLIHQPTVEMRKAGYEGHFKMLEWFKDLFQLKD